jgi:hypothetical protein
VDYLLPIRGSLICGGCGVGGGGGWVLKVGWRWWTGVDGGQCGEVVAAENHDGRPIGAAVPGRSVGFLFLLFCKKFDESP